MDKRGLFGIDSSAFSLKGEKIMYRDHTKVVQIGDKKIGGGNPILIQSRTNTKTENVEATVRQILELELPDVISSAAPYRRWKQHRL